MSSTKNKDRVTITLSKKLLPLLDNFIDGEKIRNRSHAIEYILGQHLGLGIQTAVILAGAGNDGEVHALATIRNRPVIEYIFDLLRAHGIRGVIMVIDRHGKKVQEFIGDGSQWKMNVTYVQDEQSTGTANALGLVKKYIKETFLLVYSDILADINLGDFVEYHRQFNAIGTVALTHKKKHENYGVARMEGSRIVSFEEKPGEDSKHGLVNAGMYLFEPKIFEYLEKSALSLEKDILPQAAQTGKLIGYPFQGRWFDISREDRRKKAETDWV